MLVCLLVGCNEKSGGGEQGGGGETRPPADMTLKAFILQKPTKPVSVDVECTLTTYYNYEFSNSSETHYSVKIESQEPFATAHAYAPKTSAHGKRLYESLKDGSTKRARVRVQRLGPDGQPLPSKDDSCFSLVGIAE